MSAENLGRVLIRAIEARNPHDRATRNGVYALSRETLERFLDQNAELTDATKDHQRRELEQQIAQIEARYGLQLADERVRGLEDQGLTGSEVDYSPVAPSSSAAQQAPPAETAGNRAVEYSDEGPDEIRCDSGGETAENSTRPAGEAGPTDDEVSTFEQREAAKPTSQTRRNAFGIAILAAVLSLFGLGYRTEEGETLRRMIMATLAHTRGATEGSGSGAGTQAVQSEQLGVPDLADASDVRLRVEKTTLPSSEFAGRILWSDAENGGLSGKLSLVGNPLTAEVIVEPSGPHGKARTRTTMVAMRVAGLPRPLLGEPSFEFVDSAGRAEHQGPAVRIGIDRLLFSYDTVEGSGPETNANAGVLVIGMTTEAEEKLYLYLRLPGVQ